MEEPQRERRFFIGCENCDGGLIRLEAPKSGIASEICDCVRRRLWEKLGAPGFGIPRRFAKADAEDVEDAKRRELLDSLLDSGESVFIHGDVGTGKTYLGAALLREYFRRTLEGRALSRLARRCSKCGGSGLIPEDWSLRRDVGDIMGYQGGRFDHAPCLVVLRSPAEEWADSDIPVEACYSCGGWGLELEQMSPPRCEGAALYVSCPELIADYKRAFDGGGAVDALLEPILTAPLLVLDEFGAGFYSDYFSAEFFRIVDRRYSSGLQTVYLSNLSAEEVRNSDPRIHSRLVEDRAPVTLTGVDRRLGAEAEAS